MSRHFQVERFYKRGWNETPTPEHLEAVRNCKTVAEYQVDKDGNRVDDNGKITHRKVDGVWIRTYDDFVVELPDGFVEGSSPWKGIVRENPAVKPSAPEERKAYHAARNIEQPVPCRPRHRAAAAKETPKLSRALPIDPPETRRVCRSCRQEWHVVHKCPERDDAIKFRPVGVPESSKRPDPNKYFQVIVVDSGMVPMLSPKGLSTYNAKKKLAQKPLEMKTGGDLTPLDHDKLMALRTDPDLIATIEELGPEIALTDDCDVRIVMLPVSVRQNLEIDELDDRECPLPDYQDVVCDMIAMAGETDWKSTFEQCRELIMLNRR